MLAALNAPLAADTLEEMNEELASAALVEMPRERAAAVIGHIEPDDAADMLADLPDEVVEKQPRPACRPTLPSLVAGWRATPSTT